MSVSCNGIPSYSCKTLLGLGVKGDDTAGNRKYFSSILKRRMEDLAGQKSSTSKRSRRNSMENKKKKMKGKLGSMQGLQRENCICWRGVLFTSDERYLG